ncbi:MAG: hypothetical protein ACOC6J_03105 [Spirochaetota bacterium]
MIARLVLGPSGPLLLAQRRLGPRNRLIVLVSEELSTTAPPDRWPTQDPVSAVLVARVAPRRLYARASLASATGLARPPQADGPHRVSIVPEQALRARKRRRPDGRPFGQPRRLSRFAFRNTAVRRRRLRSAGAIALLTGAVAAGLFAFGSLASSARELTRLESERRSLQRARAAIADLLVEEKAVLAAGELDTQRPVAPLELLERISATLEPGERIRSFRLADDALTLVIASNRGLALVRSIGSIAGVHDATGSLRSGEAGTTVTVEARTGAHR